MADQLQIRDMEATLLERAFPSITVYNRLEGRPRSRDLERALRAEVRDALWALTRQWQVGEFEGTDAGSPFLAKVLTSHRSLTRYRPREGAAGAIDDHLPLEAQVEQRPLPLAFGGRAVALDLRLLMGRQWLKLTADVADYVDAFQAHYPIEAPDPSDPADADRAAHAEAWQTVAAVAGRAMDGAALYEHLTANPANHAYDGVVGVAFGDHAALDARAERFVAWFHRQFQEPASPDGAAWDPSRLEYRFAISSVAPDDEKVYVADGYAGGHLDWWALDVDRGGASLADPSGPVPAAPVERLRTLIPTAVRFEGIPNTRWWAFEDSKTNFGDVDAATTDIAKLLFLEFGLVYANDWFLVPVEAPAASIVTVGGIALTTVFGERYWIEPAGAGADNAWQRWSMFTVNARGGGTNAADTSLVLLPTVPKIQEGEPLEELVLIRDEMANMVWAIERTIALPNGAPKRGVEAARETDAYLRRIAGTVATTPASRVADVRYQVMSQVPEHWIPFVPVHVPGSVRETQLQRAALPRLIEGLPIQKVRPRTSLAREGLDAGEPYFVHEEEVPRAGTILRQQFQRTRWRGGRAVVWLGVTRETGRGEGSSGLAFDQLVDVPP